MWLDLASTDRLIERIRSSHAPGAELFSAVAAAGQNVEPGIKQCIDRLAATGAFTDAALVLIGRMLPAWRIRSLVWESGEWTCILSRHPILPVALDDTADGRHPSMPLAILTAALEATGRSNSAEVEERPPSAPQWQPATGHVVCCDNFR